MNLRMLAPAALALVLVGCCKKDAPLTEAQKAALVAEVKPIALAWKEAGERSDFQACMALYAPASDFPQAYADIEGRLNNFPGLRKAAQDSYEGATRYDITLGKQMFTVLGPDLVLWAFQGAWKGSMKNGAEYKCDAVAVSILFRRAEGTWRIVYQHESSPTPVEVKAAAPPRK
jgi:ketosteroid isomerase-like protein